MNQTSSDLLPRSITVSVADESIIINRVNTEQVLSLVDVLFSVYKTLLESGGSMTLTGLVAALPDAVFRILAVTTDKSTDFYRNADPIEVLDVAEAWWEVNGDFFVNRLVPRLQKMAARLEATKAGS